MMLRPIALKAANQFIDEKHRHHFPVVGHRFSLSAYKDNVLVGVAVIGRPVARMVPHEEVLEVTRLATDGTKNACSFLYAAAARAGKELGYRKIQTYILETELGTTLRAAGWELESKDAGGGLWVHTDGKSRRYDQPTMLKQRWAKHFYE